MTDGVRTTPQHQTATPRPAAQAWRLDPRARQALSAASLLVLAVVLARWGLFVVRTALDAQGRYDFASYYVAASALRTDLHANIYDPAVFARAGAAAGFSTPPLPYTYPPLLALVLSPLTALGFKTVARFWLVGNVAVWIAVTLLLARELRLLLGDRLCADTASRRAGMPDKPRALAHRLAALADDPSPLVALAASAAVCLTGAPAAQTLLTGQINFWVLLPLALVPWLTHTRRESATGVAIAVAALLKLTPALLLAYLLLRRRWRALAAALVALAVLSLVCVAIVGPGTFAASLTQALQVGTGDAGLGHNQALFAPIALAVGPGSSAAVLLVGRLLLVALALWLGIRLWRARPHVPGDQLALAAEYACYGAALCALLLLSPVAWVHHYVWLLPAAALALGLAARDALAAPAARARWARVALIALACAALGATLPHAWDTEPHPAVTTALGLPLWPLALTCRPIAALVIALALAGWYARPAASASATPVPDTNAARP